MIEFKFTTTSRDIDEICEQLERLEVAAVTQQDAGNQPIYEPRPGEILHWPTMRVSALLDESIRMSVTAYLSQLEKLGTIQNLAEVTVPDKDWVTLTQMQTEPMQIGQRLYITPSWLPPIENKTNVIFNPGHAFGTGTHPTTSLCLEWLDTNIQGGETIIDYGCGSGILAIAAILLGAKRSTAVDYDPQAIDATRSNAELNHISPNSISILNSEALNNTQADIVIANIISKTLIDLSQTLISLIHPKGRLVLSGILDYQVDETVNAFNKQLTLREIQTKESWARIEFVKKD